MLSHTLDISATIPGLSVLRPDPGTDLSVRPAGPTSVEVTCGAENGRPGLHLEVDLGAAAGYWHPGLQSARTLPPDWLTPNVTSLVQSAPVGALYDAAGKVLLGWAASEAVAELSVRYGVSEERKSFIVEVRPVRALATELVVLIDVSAHKELSETLGALGAWLSARCTGTALPPKPLTRVPAYSTWYTFTQDINADVVTAEAAMAAQMGCGTIFIDDGWQRFGTGRGYQGCGDWLPDEGKFADLTATVRQIHSAGAGVALWVAPLLVGPQSEAFGRLHRFAPEFAPDLNCQVLDPRHFEVRAHVVNECVRLVLTYGIDLLKIDFLDTAMMYADSADNRGDLADVGQAMATMLEQLRRRLEEVGRPDVAFEFRQPYVSPAIARFGEILRANDCPGDSATNRASTIDARLLSVGQVVHSDPMMWGPAGGAQAVAQQLYNGWFSVPQISMMLSALSEVQATALRGLLRLWRDQSDVLLDGALHVSGAERRYDLVWAVRADLGRSVVARYADLVADLDQHPTADTSVINATPFDRLVLKTSRPILGGTAWSADGTETNTIGSIGPGILELDVSPYGGVNLRF